MGRRRKKKGLEKYEITLVLLSVLLAVMSIIMFIPPGHSKLIDNNKTAGFSK